MLTPRRLDPPDWNKYNLLRVGAGKVPPRWWEVLHTGREQRLAGPLAGQGLAVCGAWGSVRG